MAVSHVKSNTIGDFTGTVTVFNSQGSTATAAATDIVRPGDWNSAHNQYVTISGDTLGTSTASGTNIAFGGQNNVQLSMSTAAGGATVWIQNDFENYYANMNPVPNSTTMQPFQSTSAVWPFTVPYMLTASFIRLMQSGAVVAASTTAATTGNTSWSAGATKSHNFVVYSRGTGANSQSLQYVTSTQIVESFSQKWSADPNSTQFSITNRYSMPGSAGTIGFTYDYSTSVTRLDFHTSGVTGLTGFKQVDYYFPMSLSDGIYWMAYGASTTSGSNYTSIGLRDLVTYNVYGASQPNNSWGTFGAATNASVQWNPGLGSFTLGGAAGTTASIGLAQISSSASNNVPYFQLMLIS